MNTLSWLQPLRWFSSKSHVGGNFIRSIIAADTSGRQIVTRFPPEPNGFLHLGHAASICLNFGLAKEFSGKCHLRMDDTNPTTEDEIFTKSICEDVTWLGFQWDGPVRHASDYFPQLHELACELIQQGQLSFVIYHRTRLAHIEVRYSRLAETAHTGLAPWKKIYLCSTTCAADVLPPARASSAPKSIWPTLAR